MDYPQLELRLKGSDVWLVSRKAYEIIEAYLQPAQASSLASTAMNLDALTPAKRQLLSGEKREEIASFQLEFWELFISIARQVPHDHAGQERLRSLVQELKSLDFRTPEEALDPEENSRSKPVWLHLEGLENSLEDVWREPTESEDTFEPFAEWVNMNSFVARIFGSHLFSPYRFAIWTLRDSLETPETRSRDLLECRVLAAAEWIKHSSSKLFETLEETSASQGDQKALNSSSFQDNKVLSVDRWEFWKQRFLDESQTHLNEKSKLAAVEALDVMNKLNQ